MTDSLLLIFGVGISFLTAAGLFLAVTNNGWEPDEQSPTTKSPQRRAPAAAAATDDAQPQPVVVKVR